MCIDLKSGFDARMRVLPWVLLIWLLLLPVYYVVLWKIAMAETEPEHGCVGSCLGLPSSREEARQALTRFHIWAFVIAGILVIIGLIIHTSPL